MKTMQTVSETRLIRLKMLIKRYNDKLADLNEAIGLVRTDSTLSQIHNQSVHSTTGTPRAMGDVLARRIEKALNLERGWMDTPPSYEELSGANDMRAKALAVMEAMPEDQWATALRLLDALAKPTAKNGTTGHE